ncbi:prolyl-tRNA synthetase [bacterium]|nr:MAG: prolyl-tRNA synthetase [bacterium]
MQQTKLFTKTIKEAPKDETSLNARLLMQAGFVDKLMAGVYTFLPLGLRVLNKIENIIREEMNAIDGQEILMPALQPKENWDKTDRWESMDDILYKFKGANQRELTLGSTHEEIITPLMSKFVNSYKDLPFSAYQFQTKFRNEERAKSGLLRGREFRMKDLYSFHTDQDDLDQYYEKAQGAYARIFEKLGVGNITHLTYATGGAFSKYSHEYQTLADVGEDTIYLCEKCSIAVNKEIIDEQKVCPKCGNTDLKEKKSIEVGNIFKLGEKFSKAFDLKYKDQDGKDKNVLMGCYGIGPSRIMGALVEIYHDDKGIIWPEEIAPFKVHLIDIKQNEKSDKIYDELSKAGIEVLYDDRDISAGVKFADADLIGIPYRIVVSKKTIEQDSVEIKGRGSDVEMIKIEQLIDYLGV